MGFMSWLTGRDEKESDVYANFERVDDLVANLKKVSTENVTVASDAVKGAVTALNSVKGMAEYVGQVNADCFTGTFEKVASTIDQVATMIQQKADNIKAYEESAWYEKLGSTFAMAGAKLGEGLLSVAEDLGDGVVSLVGWVAPKDSGVEKWCGEFVKKEWSHDAFNFYYNSEFAKKSAFTEDSGLAGACKLVGTTAGYLFAGGALSGSTARLAGGVSKVASAGGKMSKVAGTVAKAGKTVGKLGKFASSSTWAATAAAGIGGLGSGTENELINGAGSFDAAVTSGGLKQMAIQGTLAFAGGKLGEHFSVKAGGPRQGYNDAITKAGQQFGSHPIATTGKAVTTFVSAAKSAPGTVVHAVKSAPGTVVNAVKSAPGTIVNVVKSAPGAVVNAVKSAPGAVLAVATNPSTAGIVAQGINASISNGNAAENIAAQAGYDIQMTGPTGQDVAQDFTNPTGTTLTAEQQFRLDDGTGNQNTTVDNGSNYNPGGGYDPGTGYNPPSGGGETPQTPQTPQNPQNPQNPQTPQNPQNPTTPGDNNPGGNNQGQSYIGPTDGGSDGDHTGGGFGEDGFSGQPFEINDEFGSDEGSEFDSLADIIANGDKLSKIPSIDTPIKKTSSGGASAVIPIAAGLSAAAAAGIGAKAYMDRKNNTDNEEEEEFETDDWSDEDQIEIDYNDSEGSIADQYLNDEDDYGYQADTGEKYGARNNEELADLQ